MRTLRPDAMSGKLLQQFESRSIILYGLFDFVQSVLILFRLLTFDTVFDFFQFDLVDIVN